MRASCFGHLLLTLLLAGRAAGQTPAAGLRADYYAGEHFERLVLTRTDAAIDFDWNFRAPGPGLPAESFSVRWTGWVLAPTTGVYTFHLTADDGMRVWIGGRLLLDEWRYQPTQSATAPMRLAAGRYYSVRVEYFQGSRSSRAYLGWTLPGAPPAALPTPLAAPYLFMALPATAQPIAPPPAAARRPAEQQRGTIGMVAGVGPVATPSRAPDVAVAPSRGVAVAGPLPAGQGLLATYYAGAARGPIAHQRVEPTVEVTWRGAAPAPGVPGQGFSVRWTGYVRAPETGLYVLHTEFDDATDIRFAGENVLAMEKYEPSFFLPHKPPIPIDQVRFYTAGQFYAIDLAYKDVRGVSRAVLSWVRPAEMGNPTQPNQAFAAARRRGPAVVPQQFLYPELPKPLPEPTPVVAAVATRPASRPGPRVAPRPLTRPAAFVRPVAKRPVAARLAPLAAPTLPAPPLLPDLATLRRGTAVPLPNLYFTQSTADLLPASRPTLNLLTQELRQRPELRLEIAGHTDNVGDAALNLRLSARRALVVRRYLVQQGIDSLRLTARGYGGSRPVADNRDPALRPRNRRVEVVVQ